MKASQCCGKSTAMRFVVPFPTQNQLPEIRLIVDAEAAI
jgi:hypothetical protein